MTEDEKDLLVRDTLIWCVAIIIIALVAVVISF